MEMNVKAVRRPTVPPRGPRREGAGCVAETGPDAIVTVREAAQTSYDAAFDAYLHGVGTYTDAANEETALATADSDKEDAHANVFTAAAALAFATGTIQAN